MQLEEKSTTEIKRELKRKEIASALKKDPKR